MNRAERIHDLEQLMHEDRELVSQAMARIAGYHAEIAALRSGEVPPESLGSLRTTDAIVEALRSASGALGPSDIRAILSAHGREVELRAVTATLSHLVKSERVLKVGRGSYTAH